MYFPVGDRAFNMKIRSMTSMDGARQMLKNECGGFLANT